MMEDNEFSLGRFEPERFWRHTGDFHRLLNIWTWASGVDWVPTSI